MQFQLISDVHTEFEPGVLPQISQDADILVFAGDIGSDIYQTQDYFKSVRTKTQVPILYVLGNHEFYSVFSQKFFKDVVQQFKRQLSCIKNLYLLDNEIFIFGEYTFLGSTMWTNYDNHRGILAAMNGMADFDYIYSSKYAKITADELVAEHELARRFLEDEFEQRAENTIIVTHHGPSLSLVNEQHKDNYLNCAFYSEMSDLICKYKPLVWAYGHTHKFSDAILDNTRCVCNPYGYPSETKTYVENFLIEVKS